MKAVRGDWVEVHRVVLEPGHRAPGVPEDTARVPLELRVRGFLRDLEAFPGERVRIRTLIGREIEGTLLEAYPRYSQDFGCPCLELLSIGPELKRMLRERKA